MDHDLIVEQLLDRCKGCIEHILQASDLHHVATASLAIFAQLREVAREMLQAKITLEAQQLKGADVALCCPDTRVRYLHTRLVSPQTLLGQVHILVRTFQCCGCGASLRPDDRHLGVPEGGTSPTTCADSTRLWSPNGRIAWPMTSFKGARGWP